MKHLSKRRGVACLGVASLLMAAWLFGSTQATFSRPLSDGEMAGLLGGKRDGPWCHAEEEVCRGYDWDCTASIPGQNPGDLCQGIVQGVEYYDPQSCSATAGTILCQKPFWYNALCRVYYDCVTYRNSNGDLNCRKENPVFLPIWIYTSPLSCAVEVDF